ncbi:hypothetical protein FQA39_LY15281 [Lamprigera yunnana]|nr:hypothetical protein FQA39_LY15281 [Lamprigera yunnana]
MAFSGIGTYLSRSCQRMRPSIQHYGSATALSQEKKTDLTFAVTEAEKIVGYPTSFLNLRWILTDELANVAIHLRKLIGINHPFLETARKLFIGSNLPAWGLIVLLVSKAYGSKVEFMEHDRDVTAGVLHSQRILAEVTEMLRTGIMMHKNVTVSNEHSQSFFKEFSFGNKIALLSGDILLSKSFHELACLRTPYLNEIMSASLRDASEAEFICSYNRVNVPIPTRPTSTDVVEVKTLFTTEPYETKEILGNPVAEWTVRNILAGASLLGKSCQGTLLLAKHSEEVQHSGCILGTSLALAWQAKLDQEDFLPGSSGNFSLVGAPVMLYLKRNPGFYENIEGEIDYEGLRSAIQNSVALTDTRELQRHFGSKALNELCTLPPSDARLGLENIIKTLI